MTNTHPPAWSHDFVVAAGMTYYYLRNKKHKCKKIHKKNIDRFVVKYIIVFILSV